MFDAWVGGSDRAEGPLATEEGRGAAHGAILEAAGATTPTRPVVSASTSTRIPPRIGRLADTAC